MKNVTTNAKRTRTFNKALSPDMNHGSRRGHKVCFADVVARLFFANHIADEAGEVVVARAAAHEFVQIVIPDGEEAGANLAVRSNTNAAAMSAEGVRNGCNDAD